MRAYYYDNVEGVDQYVSLPSALITSHFRSHTLHPHSHSITTNTPLTRRAPHDSGRPVPPSTLTSLGLHTFTLPSLDEVNALAKERSYKNRDEITVSPEGLGDAYESKIKNFFHEHLHEDEEIRYVRDGAGYFDVRSEGDEWVRIRLEKDDLL